MIANCLANRSFFRNLLVSLLLLGTGTMSQAQDSTYARRIIAALTDSSMYGRGYSFGGDSVAAQFIRDEFCRLGVQPLGDNYFQRYTQDVYGFEGYCKLAINGCDLNPYSDFRIVPAYNDQRRLAAKRTYQLGEVTFVGVDKLSTFVPISANAMRCPYSVEVRNLPKRVRKVDLQVPIVHFPQYATQNVCGFVPGETDTIVVLTAHYDHCGTMGDDVLFPGAHDNASGVAAVLDLARVATTHRPHYTMVFMLFSGEETGLKGSHYAAEHPLIDFDKVRVLLNIDMFCGGAEGFMVVNANADNTRPLVDKMTTIAHAVDSSLVIKRRDNAPNSDHYWFSTLCPSLFVYTLGGPYGGYHDPADMCAECGLDNYENFLAILQSLW